jgi:alpha-L-fucosidase
MLKVPFRCVKRVVACAPMHALAAFAVAAALAAPASAPVEKGSRNRPERLEWFRDLGFGMFIHWSVDAPLGGVISHSLVGADADYTRRFFDELPRRFNPRKFNPDDWAELAALAGMRYVVFTTKHHAGFCMFHTKTTPFSVQNTPFERDITREVVDAFRKRGIAVGFYFSPDDFLYLHKAGRTVARAPHAGVTPQEIPGLMAYDQAQLKELMSNYGKVDMVFLDGPAEGLREVVWDLQPDALVTRGAIETPEQRLPGVPLDRPWESCITMGTEWPYKPAHEVYKSGTQLLEMLIETRAKGGNLLLNVGPKPDGELPIEQEERLRQIALWSFTYGESLSAVRPWVVTNEGDVWFTKKKDADTVYAFVTKTSWPMGERKQLTLRSVRATPQTKVRILGQTAEVLEYRPDVDPKPKWTQTEAGLELDVMNAQRLYTDRKWVDPVVLEITNVEPGLRPPKVATGAASRAADGRSATLHGEVTDLGQTPEIAVAFQFRRKKGIEELYSSDPEWIATGFIKRTAIGPFTIEAPGLRPGVAYEYRVMVRHPLRVWYGEERELDAGR